MIAFKTKIFILHLTILLLCLGCHASDVQLVVDQKPMAEIVIPEKPSLTEKKAALVLQDFVRRITGATLPIGASPSGNMPHLIFIGRTASFKDQRRMIPLKAEGYDVSIFQGNIYFNGGSGQGLLYGVYELIEKQFGARKYDQGPATVPQKPDLSLPNDLHLRHEPDFVYRESFYPPSADKEYLDWHHLQRFEDLWGLWGHSFFKIIPPEKYFQDHPEYFAWSNGRRQATQLCLSNPDVQRLAISYIKDQIADNPDALYWSIAPMDNDGYCRCEKCAGVDSMEGGPQGSLIRFVNAVAAKFPDRFFTTLAYGYSSKAPKSIRPAKNVYIILSTIEATRSRSLLYDPNAASFRNQLVQWSKTTPNLFIWNYTTQFTSYLNPFPVYDHYQADIQYFLENRVKGVFEQGSGEMISDLSSYASYIQAKILWDPSLKAKDVEADFLQGYFGPGSGSVKDYIGQLITARDETSVRLDIYSNPIANRKDYLAPGWMEKYKNALSKAQDAVNANSKYAERIRTLRLGLEYAELEQAKSYGAHASGYFTISADGHLQIRPGWEDRVQHFVKNAQKSGVTGFSELGGAPVEYLKDWADILQQTSHSSLIFGVKPVFSTPYLPDYPANGEMTLTDGVPGGRDYSYNWLLFLDNQVVITFPVPRNISYSELRTNFLFDPRHYVFLPDEVVIEGSINGEIFTPIGKQQLAKSFSGKIMSEIYSVSIPLNGQQFSYLRIKVLSGGLLPEWFEGSRHRKPLVALDEVSIK